jgi:hypothetical protein
MMMMARPAATIKLSSMLTLFLFPHPYWQKNWNLFKSNEGRICIFSDAGSYFRNQLTRAVPITIMCGDIISPCSSAPITNNFNWQHDNQQQQPTTGEESRSRRKHSTSEEEENKNRGSIRARGG